jgi:hypothetical protein
MHSLERPVKALNFNFGTTNFRLFDDGHSSHIISISTSICANQPSNKPRAPFWDTAKNQRRRNRVFFPRRRSRCGIWEGTQAPTFFHPCFLGSGSVFARLPLRKTILYSSLHLSHFLPIDQMSLNQQAVEPLRFSPSSEAQILQMFRLSGSDAPNSSITKNSRMSEQNRHQDAASGPSDPSSLAAERAKCREISIQLATGIRVAGKHWGSKNAPIKVLALHGYVRGLFSLRCRIILMQSYGM